MDGWMDGAAPPLPPTPTAPAPPPRSYGGGDTEVDYRGPEVTADAFLRVLTGARGRRLND